ncbi:hypothetical protein DRQ25_17225 [Candidatus Fermentibacteria bacterium]|nr:MAG: hypothetical protein DRQ25_17225 [Candidatus Fermentibacteria bacterium]
MCIIKDWLDGIFFRPSPQKEEPTMAELKDANYWDNKYPKNKVTYKARGIYSMDVRNLILNKSCILENVAVNYRDKGNYDQQALALLEFVISHMTYVSDDKLYNQPEFWQHPEITLAMSKGDCEDGALLLASLMRITGIPAYRVKLCAGWVKANKKKEGHAYVIYLADDNEWYTLDWCYWPKASTFSFLKNPHKENSDYLDIWWTANDLYSWAQTTTEV